MPVTALKFILLLSLFSSASLLASTCLEREDQIEHLIRERVLSDQLRPLTGTELIDLYSSEKLGQRMKVVKEVLDSLKPFAEGYKGKSVIERQEIAVARAKAMAQLTELGMKLGEARAAVDYLLKHPTIFEKMTMIVTTIDTLIERENSPPWLIRSAGFIATTMLLLPSVTNISILMSTGYYMPIPMASKVEAASVMYLALYGARGLRLIRNMRSDRNKLGSVTLADGGKRPWSDVNAEFTNSAAKNIQAVIKSVMEKYKKNMEPWAGPYVNPPIRGVKQGLAYSSAKLHSLNIAFRSFVLDMVILLNMHRHTDLDSLLSNSVKHRPYLHSAPLNSGLRE